MAVRYQQQEEKFRNICTISVPAELLSAIEKWKVNLTLIAETMGMNRTTLFNKVKGNLGAKFTPEEYKEFVLVLKKMINELDNVLSNYPNLDK